MQHYIFAHSKEDLSIWGIVRIDGEHYFSKLKQTGFDSTQAEKLVKEFQQIMPECKFFVVQN